VHRPPTPPAHQLEPFTETWRNLKLAHGNLVVFRSLLGISWMWFFGAVFLSQFPSFAKEVLHGNEQVASPAAGGVFHRHWHRLAAVRGAEPPPCRDWPGAAGRHRHERVCHRPVLSHSAACPPLRCDGRWTRLPGAARPLARDGRPGPAQPVCRPVQRAHVCADPDAQPAHTPRPHHRGQQHPQRAVHDRQLAHRRRLAGRGFTVPQIFLFTGLANAVVAFYIFMLVPEYLLRFVAWVLSRFVYRFKVQGDQHLPTQGAAVLVCNHVSFVDAVLLMAASPRPIYFVMDHRIFRCRCWALFRLAKAIPIARARKTRRLRGCVRCAAQVLRAATCWPSSPKAASPKTAAAAVQGRHHENSGARPSRRAHRVCR
jgi:hypothetical protein